MWGYVAALALAVSGCTLLALGARMESKYKARIAAQQEAQRVEPYPVSVEALPLLTDEQCAQLAWMPAGDGFLLVATGAV